MNSVDETAEYFIWFNNYVKDFYNEDEQNNTLIRSRVQHTFEVVKNVNKTSSAWIETDNFKKLSKIEAQLV